MKRKAAALGIALLLVAGLVGASVTPAAAGPGGTPPLQGLIGKCITVIGLFTGQFEGTLVTVGDNYIQLREPGGTELVMIFNPWIGIVIPSCAP